MPYNHTQWVRAHRTVADSLLSVHDGLEATLPYLAPVQAGRTQVENHRKLMAGMAEEADFGHDLLNRYRFTALNEAVNATGGDRTEAKGYAQTD